MLLFSDESSISVSAFLSHTYAPVGKTPTVRISTETTNRLYLAGAISPKGDLIYMLRSTPFNGQAIVEYLAFLSKQLDTKIMIIWDNASIHDCKAIRAYLTARMDDELWLVKQPKYSPELNASEIVWSYLKSVILKNTCNRNIKELKSKVLKGMEEMKNNPQLVRSFFHHPQIGYL